MKSTGPDQRDGCNRMPDKGLVANKITLFVRFSLDTRFPLL